MIPARSALPGAALLFGILACTGEAVPVPSAQGVAVAIAPATTSLAPLARQAFTATVTGTVDATVTWAVVEGAVGGAVSADGVYTAPSTPGNYHVVATSKADPTKSATATVTVTVPTGAYLAFSPANHNFGSVTTGSASSPFGFTVTNSGGSAASNVFLALASGSQFSISGSSCGTPGSRTAIPAGDSCAFGVTFTPGSIGPQSDVLTITYDGGAAAGQTSTAAVSGTGASTAALGFSIPDAHPRLWWNASRLARARAWLAAHPFTPSSTDYFYLAWKHVVAGTDCAPAVAWAAAYQVPYGQWQPSAVGSDEARWYGENAFLVYDWCYDQWTAQQRSDFLANIAASGYGWNDFLAGINQQSWGGPAMTQSNYNWGNLRNDIEYGIATYWENTAPAQSFLSDGVTTRWTNHFVPSVGACQAGGVGQEGTAYGSAMIPPVIPFVSMRDGGRDILNETDFYKQYVYYVLYSTTPAPTYNSGAAVTAYQLSPFSDDEIFVSGGILNQRSYYQDWMNFASNYWSAIDVGKHARQWVNTVGAHAATKAMTRFILAQDDAPAATSYSSLPLDYYATGIQYLYGRRAWDTSTTYFHWQLGQPLPCAGVGHNHADVGNFNLWRGGRWLSRETTGYSDTIAGYGYRGIASDASESMLAHNGIVFGTPLATWGPLLPTVNAGQTEVRRLESRAGYTYADVDLTNRYLWDPGHSNLNVGAAVHVERELLFLRDLETTVVLDRLTTGNVTQGSDSGTTAANVVNTFLIHFETNPTLEDATHLTATNGTQVLRVTTLVPTNPTRRVINEQSCSGCSARIGQYRVELDTSGAAQRYFLHVLQARDAAGGNVTASVVDGSPGDPTAGTFTVTLRPSAGADTVIVFNKGRSSSGGTLALAGGGATALANGVQGIGYTDRGPVWGGP